MCAWGWGLVDGEVLMLLDVLGMVLLGAAPYSLDAEGAGLTVNDLLLLSRDNNDQAYTIDLPNNFVKDYATKA